MRNRTKWNGTWWVTDRSHWPRSMGITSCCKLVSKCSSRSLAVFLQSCAFMCQSNQMLVIRWEKSKRRIFGKFLPWLPQSPYSRCLADNIHLRWHHMGSNDQISIRLSNFHVHIQKYICPQWLLVAKWKTVLCESAAEYTWDETILNWWCGPSETHDVHERFYDMFN